MFSFDGAAAVGVFDDAEAAGSNMETRFLGRRRGGRDEDPPLLVVVVVVVEGCWDWRYRWAEAEDLGTWVDSVMVWPAKV